MVAFIKTAGTTLALALSTASLVAPALAQDRGDRGEDRRGGWQRGANPGGGNWQGRPDGQRPEQPAGGWNGGGWTRPAPQAAPQSAPPQPQAQARPDRPRDQGYADPRRDRGYGGGSPATVENRPVPQQGWDGRRWNGQNWNDRRPEPRPEPRRDDGPRPTWQRDRGWDGSRGWNDHRGWDRDRDDPRRGNWSAGRPGGVERGNWNRDWRRDNRYNWQGWRDSHHDVYRVGRYLPPYRTYAYRRVGIGFVLDGGYFGANYWINDPWTYRLPPAYGPYRWVRYYDDALLVDTYTGEVVDVIYDFFW